MKKNFDQWWYDHPYLKKLTMKLKIIFAICVTCLANVFAEPSYSQSARISLDMENSKLEQVMDEIEKKSEFYFIFNQSEIDINRVVDIKADNQLITRILPKLFEGVSVDYEIIDRKILLTRGEVLNVIHEEDQQFVVRGKITDASGAPLAGVNVVLKGTLVGSTSDGDGNYSLNVPNGSGTLVFTFIGFTPLEVAIEKRNTINVSLDEELQSLDEVVVTALGIKREARTLGYATSDIKKEQISENRATTALGTLQGKISGVNITSLTRGPQGSNKIRIRGQSSFSGTNTPLIVVDGMPIDNTSYVSGGAVSSRGGSVNNSDGGDGLSSINMDDVVSMTVLKGAAAAALYGSRAKDGVIMITTRQRGEGKGIGVELNTNYTTDTPLDFTDLNMNTDRVKEA